MLWWYWLRNVPTHLSMVGYSGSLLSFLSDLGLLFELVRNWYARNPKIVETEDALVVLAQECAHAFIDGR